MNDDFTIDELFYCLIQDIEDYLMRADKEKLQSIVNILTDLKEKHSEDKFGKEEKQKMKSVVKDLKSLNIEEFYEDAQVIMEQLQWK